MSMVRFAASSGSVELVRAHVDRRSQMAVVCTKSPQALLHIPTQTTKSHLLIDHNDIVSSGIISGDPQSQIVRFGSGIDEEDTIELRRQGGQQTATAKDDVFVYESRIAIGHGHLLGDGFDDGWMTMAHWKKGLLLGLQFRFIEPDTGWVGLCKQPSAAKFRISSLYINYVRGLTVYLCVMQRLTFKVLCKVPSPPRPSLQLKETTHLTMLHIADTVQISIAMFIVQVLTGRAVDQQRIVLVENCRRGPAIASRSDQAVKTKAN